MRMRNRWSQAVRRRHRPTECIRERVVDPTSFGQMIARQAFIEAVHLDSPFHRSTLAADREAAPWLTRDGHDPKIDRRRESAIDGNLGFAGCPASVEKSRNGKRTARLILSARSPARKTEAAWVSMRLTGAPPWLAGSLKKPITGCCEASAVISVCPCRTATREAAY
jgi:hypothetical protein